MKVKEITMNNYTAYVLDAASRVKLAEKFPPKYPNFIGHHITVEFGVLSSTPVPEHATTKVIGYADSGDGIEALVVSVNGSVDRPDGSIYHITWSLDSAKYSPKDSNSLLARSSKKNQYTLVLPININTTPQLL